MPPPAEYVVPAKQFVGAFAEELVAVLSDESTSDGDIRAAVQALRSSINVLARTKTITKAELWNAAAGVLAQ